MEINGNPKLAKKFYCKNCNYSCRKESDYKKHLTTLKHAKNGNISKSGNFLAEMITSCKTEKNAENVQSHSRGREVSKMEIMARNSPKNSPSLCTCICGKIFKTKSGLWKHHKRCIVMNENTTPQNAKKMVNNSFNDDNKSIDIMNITKEMMNHFMDNLNKVNLNSQDKDEDIKDLMVTMFKNNQDFQKGFMEMIPHLQSNFNNNSNNVYNTNHNTISNNFNIQMFLHDKCKNAMNLTDFIETLPITSATYDDTIENGLTKTITTMFVDGLKNMDVLERPIHCTDPNRKTLYIKENDVWGKDDQLKQIEQGITRVALKQRTSINKWQDANKGWDTDENLQTKMTSLVYNTMTNVEKDERETNKIIRAISKNTYLTNEIKDVYK